MYKNFNLIYSNFENLNLSKLRYSMNLIMFKDNNWVDDLLEFKLTNVNYRIYGNVEFDEVFKISIVIPIYNNETMIHRTLMSIENQTFEFKDIEVLMVNDASTDNTSKIINQYVDKYSNFKAIHIKNGTGSAGTPRNLGLKLASADYVMFLDHDDFLEIDALEKLYEKITNYGCDFVYGTFALIDGDKPIKFLYSDEIHGYFNSLDDNPRAINTPPSIWTKLFRKEFLFENNILFPTILGEDIIFMSKALKYANGIYYLGEDIICYYNLNENSYTSNLSFQYFFEGFTSERYLFNLYSEWKHPEYYALRGQGILNYYINRFMLSNLNEKEIKNIFPLFNEFCERLHKLDVLPNNERNDTVFNFIIKNDIDGLIKFKNHKPNRFKVISNKVLNKINKHGFW